MIVNVSPARRALEIDVKKHIQDIAEKYIIPGETAESAILFLPSESVYAEINIQLPKMVEASRKARVYMAGPDNLMLLLHTVRAILRDARMHEAAGLIQTQVDLMMKDVHRLEDRVVKLATHFPKLSVIFPTFKHQLVKSFHVVIRLMKLKFWTYKRSPRRPKKPDMLS